MSTRRAATGGALVTALSLATLAPAAAPRAPVDAELLEFLGSLDTEDEEWRDFLAERPPTADGAPKKDAPEAKPPDARKPAASPAPPRKDTAPRGKVKP